VRFHRHRRQGARRRPRHRGAIARAERAREPGRRVRRAGRRGGRMRRPLATVYIKELRDALRDRRTALMIFVASVLTGPLLLVLMAQFMSSQQEKVANPKVLIAGQERAPELVNFLRRYDVEIEEAPKDYEARIKQGTTEAVVVVPEDFPKRLASGEG